MFLLFFFLGKVLQVPSVEELSIVSRHVLHDIAPLPMGIKAMCIVGGSKHSLTAKRQAHWNAGTPDHVSMAVPAELWMMQGAFVLHMCPDI